MLYNPADCYWIVANDTSQVWSSKIMQYIPASDTTYRAWSQTNPTSRNPARADLAVVMQQDALPLYLNTVKLIVTSAGSPDASGTYELDTPTLTQIGNAARDVASGIGLPTGTFTYIDITGTLRVLSAQNVVDLYKAMTLFVAQTTIAVQLRVMGTATELPGNSVTIP